MRYPDVTLPGASGAETAEWRGISRHSGDIAPLTGTGPAGTGRGAAARRWPARAALAVLLGATALLYLYGLGASGYANDFYAAAVQAGTRSWKAMFFGSFDSSNFITVDKPPLSLWPMELSGRIFGFGAWSMLVPQAIMGVLSVWLLHATVRRWFGPGAGLLAGAMLALTPVAVLMFRFNNPDAMMTLLVVAAAYCVTRAIERASLRWLLLCGAVLGLSFLAKGLQPFTVLPALAVAYLVTAPTSLRRRIGHLLAAGGAVMVGAGWWILAVQLAPAADRPYIGGSGDNTALGLAFGYNGLGRITGDETGSGGGGAGVGFDGATGIGRMFNTLNGGQIAWLLPAALLAVVALIVITRRAPRTDRTRAALIIFGGWLLVTGAVLSYASGIIHTYYTVELAPAIAALVAIGATVLWRRRRELAARIGLAAGVLVTGWWSYRLLHRAAGWQPWVAQVILVAAALAAISVLFMTVALRAVAAVAIVAGLVAIGGGSAAYALDTAVTPHTGSTPTAGPSSSGGFGGPGGSGGGRGAGGGPGGAGSGTGPGGGRSQGGPPGSTRGSSGGGFAGPTQTASTALTALLKSTTTRWAAATIGSQSAAPLELASGTAVMAIGGFSGSDDAPTLAQFEALVANGEIHYFVAGGTGGGPGGGSGSAITSWVRSHFSSTTVGGSTVYDLTKAKS